MHDHTLAGPLLARGREVPTVVTMHGPVADEPGEYYRQLGDTISLVAISAAQRRAAPDLAWRGTVHNAVDVTASRSARTRTRWCSSSAGCTRTRACTWPSTPPGAAGLPIVIAGKCSEPVELEYFRAAIEPRLGPDVTIFGPADAAEKRDLLARAAALVFPIQWEEPFGMVMIEAMACGTPVVALRRGAVPEVVSDGVTGILCDDPAELSAAITAARSLSPAACRAHVEGHFDAASMVRGYEAVYREVLVPRMPTWRDDVLVASPRRTRRTPAPAAA